MNAVQTPEQKSGATGPPSPPEEDGKAALDRAAAGETIDGAEERSALDWLLGATRVLEYDVPVDYETPDGMKKLTFHIRQLDPDKIDEIENNNRKGDGPFARVDRYGFNVDLAAEATLYFTDESGRKVEPTSEEFRGGMPGGTAQALRVRFKGQGGIFAALSDEIQSVSGFSPDRVGTAQRVLVEGGKGS